MLATGSEGTSSYESRSEFSIEDCAKSDVKAKIGSHHMED